MVLTRSQRTITLQSLPRELLARCFEFLPFAEVQPYDAMNEGPRVSIFRNREGEDLSFFEPF